MLKRNLSLESRSNIKFRFRVCLWRVCHQHKPIIPRRFLSLFSTVKVQNFTTELFSNHQQKLIELNNSLLERYSLFTTLVEPCTCGFTHHSSFVFSESDFFQSLDDLQSLTYSDSDLQHSFSWKSLLFNLFL